MGQEEVDLQRDVDLAGPQCYSVDSVSVLSSSPISREQASFAQGIFKMEAINSMESPSITKERFCGGERNAVSDGKCETTVQGINDCDTRLSLVAEDLLILQAQILLTKNTIYQKIGVARQQLVAFPSDIYRTLPRALDNERSNLSTTLTSLHRDASVNSLRFLNIFCNCSPSTFFLAAGLLDRLISTVQVHPWYMTSISTCCFYLAAKTCEPRERIPDPSELLKLSRCADNLKDFHVTERRVLETLRGNAASVTALSFLENFYNVFKLYLGGLYQYSVEDDRTNPSPCDNTTGQERSGNTLGSETISKQQQQTGSGFNEQAFAALAAKLEVLICQFEFSQFRGDVLALALLSYDLQERGILGHPDQFALVVELQYYCQISDVEFIQCRGLVIEYLAMYHQQPTKLPRLQLAWSISRRTLHKMKPSTRASQDLEPILEDEPLLSPVATDEETDDDSGPFDSECDDIDVRGVGVDETSGSCDSLMQYRETAASDNLQLLPPDTFSYAGCGYYSSDGVMNDTAAAAAVVGAGTVAAVGTAAAAAVGTAAAATAATDVQYLDSVNTPHQSSEIQSKPGAKEILNGNGDR